MGISLTTRPAKSRPFGNRTKYNYDTLHRLTHTAFNQRTLTPYEGFVYDHLGNHVTQDNNGTTVAGLFNSANEQTKRGAPGSEVDVLYDKKGNLTQDDTGQVYFYDRQNMLTRVEKPAGTLVASYSYDAFNRRIEKDVNGGAVTRFYWDGWQMLEETDNAGTPALQRYSIWGGTYIDEQILFHDHTSGGAGTDYFTCRAHNFNIVTAINTSGGVVERYDYNPYGARFVLDPDYADDVDGLSDICLTIGHQGKMHDEESGLIHYQYRDLHPRLGRWVQPDPIGYPDGMNRYAAYHVMHGGIDPTGLWKIERKRRDLATAEAEKDDTMDTLGKAVGLDGADFQKWVTLSGTIKLATTNLVTLQTLKARDKICPGQKVEVPNIALVYWAGVVGGVGKQWAGYNDDRGTLRRRGFKVDEQGGLMASGLTTHIATGMQNKTLHGMYYWGHGFKPNSGFGNAYGAITNHYAWTESDSVWGKYDQALHDWNNNGQQGAAPVAPTVPHPSAYVLWWKSINPPYKFGFVISNTCYSDNPEAKALISSNGIFYGASKEILVPTPFFIGRKSVADIIRAGAQGTKK